MQKRSIKDQSDLKQSIAPTVQPEKNSPAAKESLIKEDIKQSIQESKPTASIKLEKKEEDGQKESPPKSMNESTEKKKEITFSNIKIETYLKGSENPASTEQVFTFFYKKILIIIITRKGLDLKVLLNMIHLVKEVLVRFIWSKKFRMEDYLQ